MPRLFIFMNAAAVVALVVTGLLGFRLGAATADFTHMNWAVATTLLGLLGHSLLIFHFVGAARFVRDACRDDRAAWALIAEARLLRRRAAARALLASLMLMIQLVAGTAVYVHRLAAGWHQFGFWVTLVVLMWALYGQLAGLRRLHEILMAIRDGTPSTGR